MSATPPPVTGHFAHADPNASPITLNGLIDILNPLFSAKINGSYIPYLIQHGTPGADQNAYAWIELDSGGRPLALRIYYNGKWRRIYNGMIGEIRMYSGDPGDDTTWSNLGHGIIGGEYDGWQICNGNNSSPDLSDKFIIGAHMNDKDGHTKYNKHWQTFVDGKTDLQTGGSKDHMIAMAELPPINTDDGTSDLMIGGNEHKDLEDNNVHETAKVVVDVNYANQHAHTAYSGANYGSSPNASPFGTPIQAQLPVPMVPPFYALAYIVFQGYT